MNNSVSLPSPGIAPAIFRKTREERGLSQAQVATALGVPRSSVTVLESDELRAKLERFYGIKPESMREALDTSVMLDRIMAAGANVGKIQEKSERVMAHRAARAAHVSTIAFNVVVGGFFLMFAVGAGFALTGGAL